MSKKFTAAIIGLGGIGYGYQQFKLGFVSTHFEAYTKNKNIKLVAVCDNNEELVSKVSRATGIKGYTNVAKMMQEAAPNFVSICTPDQTHYTILNAIVGAPSVRGIWCEKPLALTLRDAREMVTACAKKNRILAVNFFRRYDPFFIKLKKNLPKLVGDVRAVTCYYSGGLVTAGSHVADLLDFLFGAPDSLVAQKNIRGYAAQIKYPQGFVVNLVPLNGQDYHALTLDIWGSKGRIETFNKPFAEYEYRYSPLNKSTRAPIAFIGHKEATPFSRALPRTSMENVVADLIQCAVTKRSPVSSGKTALKSLELISAIVLSANKKSKAIILPLKQNLTIKLPSPGGDVRLWKKN